jgi:ABC-type polysaccharide/polyol phosphate transport system ATPase subunit
MSQTDWAIRARDLGLRFRIRAHQGPPTVHSGIVRFLKHRQPSKEFWALRHLTFDVAKGSVLGVIGSNGSGKSTLLRVLARIHAPDEGELAIRGKVSSLITLGAGFNANLSGMENIRYNALLLGLTKQDIADKLDDIVKFAELGDFINAPVRTYSSGMRARLGFSVAIHVDPEILVVDEVLAVGDARFRQRCAEKMQELFSRGVTVVLVNHSMEAILQMSHRCMWLDKGAIKKLGEPVDVVKEYLTFSGLPMIEARADFAQKLDPTDVVASTDAGMGGDFGLTG